jgi:hypothetical protein
LPGKDHSNFELLKQKIVEVMQQSYPGINPVIEEWKGQEITDFQEDLRVKVNANLSEKWFYTHMKSEHDSLPRIDILNILSRYAGYANWDDFVFRSKSADAPTIRRQPILKRGPSPDQYFMLIPVVALIILAILFGLFKFFNTREYRFCLVDADTREPIREKAELVLLPEGESPVHYFTGNDGCFLLKTDKSRIRLVVRAPYYRTDTIVRTVRKLHRDETVMLKADDYALMIHYFSMMKVDDWERRRAKLDSLIDERAIIYQVISDRDASGIMVLDKQEFIGKLTIPSGSLRNIEILRTGIRNGKIMLLRFRINDKKR